uniref:SUMO-activating enzyme subunit 1 n=1 Tax=Cacopsylla melanoneura TaxID=428564 RepID=A0A8D9F9X4_9HEMI
MFGYAFADLQQYKWFKEKSLEEEKVNYSPLKDIVNIDLKTDEDKKIALKNPVYLLFLVVQKFHQSQGRYPLPEHRAEDIETLKSTRSSLLEPLTQDPVAVLPDEYFTNIFSKLAPVCAITAGIVCQEVTAAISQKQVLFNNMFLFSPTTHIGYFFKATSSSAPEDTKSTTHITNIEMVDEIL